MKSLFCSSVKRWAAATVVRGVRTGFKTLWLLIYKIHDEDGAVGGRRHGQVKSVGWDEQ